VVWVREGEDRGARAVAPGESRGLAEEGTARAEALPFLGGGPGGGEVGCGSVGVPDGVVDATGEEEDGGGWGPRVEGGGGEDLRADLVAAGASLGGRGGIGAVCGGGGAAGELVMVVSGCGVQAGWRGGRGIEWNGGCLPSCDHAANYGADDDENDHDDGNYPALALPPRLSGR